MVILVALAVVVSVFAVGMRWLSLKSSDHLLDEYVVTDNILTEREHMLVGWCLGNSLDSIIYRKGESVSYYETAWGNPVTTKDMIDKVKQSGFNAVRVPVTWNDHMDENGTVDADWLDRVKEVVSYV